MDHNHDDHNHHGDHGSPSVVQAVTNATIQLTTMAVKAMTTSEPDHQHHQMTDHGGHDDHGNHGDHSGHGGHDMDMDMNCTSPMMHMMQMFFEAGTDVTILFKEWHVKTPGAMVGAVIGVILLALLYEGLKFLREQLYRQQFTRLSYSTCAVTSNSMPQCSPQAPAELHKITQTRILSWPHLLQTCLHVTQVLLSYVLMLIFMTFNVWLCLGVLIGSGAGYFLFGWRKSTIVDISDHCH